MAETLTETQRVAVEAMDAAKEEGMAQSVYARGKGLELQPVHDAIATLRRRRALPGSDRPRKRKTRFLAIRVTSSPVPVTEIAQGHGPAARAGAPSRNRRVVAGYRLSVQVVAGARLWLCLVRLPRRRLW
jgi:hypothetical protein